MVVTALLRGAGAYLTDERGQMMREGRCAWGHPESFTPRRAPALCGAQELELFSKEKPFSEAMATAKGTPVVVLVGNHDNFSVLSQ